MNIFITGRPQTGKSTLVKKVKEDLEKSGFDVGGILTPEIRVGKKREGFKIVSTDGWKGVLASKETLGPKFAGYKINMEDLRTAADKIENFLETKDIIIIDEIGKMEFFSDKFKKIVDKAIESDKKLLAVLHRDFVQDFKDKGKIFEIKENNFDKVYRRVLELL